MRTRGDDHTQEQPAAGAKERCPECHMAKKDWPDSLGVSQDGEVYCCQGCADGTGCTCEGPTA